MSRIKQNNIGCNNLIIRVVLGRPLVMSYFLKLRVKVKSAGTTLMHRKEPLALMNLIRMTLQTFE